MTTDTRATGPRTEAGKAISARNSTKHGLFAQRDFILEGEGEEYAQTFSELMAELSPGGILEQTFATEIMGATWRLRRFGILEFDLARTTDAAPEAQDAIQRSVDRARAQSHNILRRSLTELRKLQTERHARILMTPDGEAPTDLGLTDSRQAVKSAAQSIPAASSFCKPPESTPPGRSSFRNEPTGSSFCNPAQSAPATAASPTGSSFCKPPESAPAASRAHTPATEAPNNSETLPLLPRADASKFTLAEIEALWRREQIEFEAFLDGSSFCKPPAATPRNAPCPCGSGVKYKRCCGKNAPPVLNTAH